MPNPSEMARLLGRDDERVAPDDAAAALDEAVERLGVVVALRGADTWIGAPDGSRFVARLGHPGLATAGSGDVLAGALAGLLARGADPVRATVWAVYAHAIAGRELTTLHAGIGLLARELPERLPRVIGEVGAVDG